MYFNKKQSSQSLLLQYFNSWIIIYLCFSSWMVWYMWCSVCLWNWHLLLCAHIWNPKVVIYPFHKCFLCWNLRKALSLNMDFIDSVSRAFDDIYGSPLTPLYFQVCTTTLCSPCVLWIQREREIVKLVRCEDLLTNLGLGSNHSLSNSLENCGTDILIYLP